MADEHIRAPDDKLRPGLPTPGSRTDLGVPLDNHHPDDEPSNRSGEPPHGFLHEAVMLVRWLIGLVIVLVFGWAGIVVVALFARGTSLPVPRDPAILIAAFASLGLFILLERNFWLSRFMGLRILIPSSPLGEAIVLWVLGVPGLLLRATGEPTPSPETRRGKGHPATESDSLREVVETVVFVIVLVLMLKTFVAEAFVIPTGSMATTLLGYHRNVTCPACGHTFPVNISAEVDPQNNHPEQITGCTCPNCRLHISFDLQNHQAGFLP